MKVMAQVKNQQAAPSNQQNQAGTTQPQPPPAQAPPHKLTAESLKQLQDESQRHRAASLQKNQDKAPAAPTSSQPPFTFGQSFGQQSPHGQPTYIGENQLTQDKLTLPPSKKRKNQASAANTPAQTVQTPGQQSPPPKSVSPIVQRAAPPPKIKCTAEGCKKTFGNQTDLDKHMADTHAPKEEEIEDPLAYCLESFRIVLNLDDQGKAKTTDPPTNISQPMPSAMKKSASTASQPLKQESATPMSRNPTGTGPSPSAVNHLRTPQPAAGMKTPQSDAAKSTAKSTPSKQALPPTSSVTFAEQPAKPDPWSTAKITKDWLPTVFADVANINSSPSPAVLTDWLSHNPFNVSDEEGEAPKQDSDISFNDDLDITLSAREDEDWEFDMLGAGDGDDNVVGDPILEMDWISAFGDAVEDGKGVPWHEDVKGEEAGWVSEEFMRVWRPGELEARKKREEERRARKGKTG